MSNDRPTPWGDAVVCAMCGWRLLPPNLRWASVDDEAVGIVNRPDLNCPSCGQCHHWHDSSGWVPAGNGEAMGGSGVHELAGASLVGHARRGGSAPEEGSRRLPQ